MVRFFTIWTTSCIPYKFLPMSELSNIWNSTPCTITSIAGRSGLVVPRFPAAPRMEPRCSFCVFLSQKLQRAQFLARAAHLLQCLCRNSFPTPSDGKWVSTLWLNNKRCRWVNVRLTAAYRRTQKSSLQFDLRVGGHLSVDQSELSNIASRRRW